MTNLLIINPQAAAFRERLQPKFPDLAITVAANGDEAADLLPDAHILTIIAPFLREVDVRKAKSLQWIQALTSGVENVLAFPSLRPDVLITTVRGVHAPQMSEMAVLCMLSLLRQFPRILQNQRKRNWERWPQPVLQGKTAGIIGLGAIGKEIARKCKVFGMEVVGILSELREIENVDRACLRAELPRIAPELDFLIAVVPHSPETDRIVSAEVLAAMKPTAFVINIARGRVVDEAALIDTLRERRIGGAALDVFNEEPLPAESPLWGMENVILTPHVGGMSDIYVDQTLPILEENLRRFLGGDRDNMINLVKR